MDRAVVTVKGQIVIPSKLRRVELVTGDKEFRQVEGEIKVLWLYWPRLVLIPKDTSWELLEKSRPNNV